MLPLRPAREPHIEGAEVKALGGAAVLLHRLDVRWLIETHSADLERECLDILHLAGYKTRVISPAWWRFFLPEQRCGHNRWLAAAKDIPLNP